MTWDHDPSDYTPAVARFGELLDRLYIDPNPWTGQARNLEGVARAMFDKGVQKHLSSAGMITLHAEVQHMISDIFWDILQGQEIQWPTD